MSTRVIAIANQKGGTGKTTTAVNLAAGLARGVGNSTGTLLIDMDPQANATRVLLGDGFLQKAQGRSVYELLFAEQPAEVCVHQVVLEPDPGGHVPAGRLGIIPSHSRMAMAELGLVSAFQRESCLRRGLEPLLARYAFVIMDCPPMLGLLTVNALMAATEVLIPVDPGLFALDGLGWLQQTINKVKQGNPDLLVMGILPTLIDNTVVSRDTIAALTAMVDAETLLPAIPRRTTLRESQIEEQDIFAFAPQSDGAAAYKALVREVRRRG